MAPAAPAGGAASTWLVEVALPVPLPQNFTYRWDPDGDGEPPVAGDLVAVPFGRRRRVVGLAVGARAAAGDVREVDGNPLRKISEILGSGYRLGADRLALAEWLAEYYALPLGEVVPLFHPPAPGTRRRASRSEPAVFPLDEAASVVLTPPQAEAAAMAADHLERREFGVLLLHGVTGSGKTEVYLNAVARALALGRSALFLLPEIALTPQTEARIRARFGDLVGVLHSGLSAGERCRVHEAAATGEIRVVLGPRSALFAPLADLGLVVVDEEHETSYKQEEKPRYHARHAALIRARAAGAFVILGSATPDLASYRSARLGRFRLVRLPGRPVGEMPQVEIVDMRRERSPEGFSDRLLELIEQGLEAGRQSILYYNRRGFARVLQCASCGESPACPSCDIALTLHLRPRRLLCHYCGHSRPAPPECPECGGEDFLPGGGGTEKVELALAAQFPGARVLRLDHDATRRRGSHADILSRFAAGEADVLVGTQMVAKGHHFPNVDLVGVLAADDGLTLPDFRAQERAFQLLMQVAGRTGRTAPGRVVFQTWQPDHPVIRAAATHDYESFAESELAVRDLLGYPPARRLLRLAVVGRRLGDVEAAAARLAKALREAFADGGPELLGPAPAVFPRLQDRYRWQILLKGNLSAAQKAWLAACARTVHEGERGLDVVLDVDPTGLY